MKTTRWILPMVVLLAACRTTGAGGDVKPDGANAKPGTAAVAHAPVGTDPGGVGAGTPLAPRPGDELAAFAGGCFWGVEDMFRQVPGVVATAVGYTGGHTPMPTYEQVCTHTTGHAEAVLVEFDPKKVSFDSLLSVFFKNHDPTTLNRQGPDHGDQYRSAVFTFSDDQDRAVRVAIDREQLQRPKPIVTRVSRLGAFFRAEDYHQQYDEKTGTHSCPIGLPTGS